MIKRKDKTRTKDIGTIGCERREVYAVSEALGYLHYGCPFCYVRLVTVKWSLQGTGKACECGALFKMFDETVVAYKKEIV